MRPVISKIMELNGRTYALPIPARYLELLECVNTLGIKVAADEDGIAIQGYRSLIGVTPDDDDTWREIDETAACLAMLTPEQLDAVSRLCAAFGLTFGGVGMFFNFIGLEKGLSVNEMKKSGVPAAEKTDKGAD